MKYKSRLLAMMLILALVIGLIPSNVFAELDAEPNYKGYDLVLIGKWKGKYIINDWTKGTNGEQNVDVDVTKCDKDGHAWFTVTSKTAYTGSLRLNCACQVDFNTGAVRDIRYDGNNYLYAISTKVTCHTSAKLIQHL